MTAEIVDYINRCGVYQRVNDRSHKLPATLHPVPVTPDCRHYAMQQSTVHCMMG